MKKKTLFVSLFVLISACTKGLNIPVENSTAEERELVDSILEDVKIKLMSFNHEVDFDQIPLVITNDISENRAGTCYKGNTNSHIRISKEVVKNALQATSYFYLWRTITHEIGHCYFDLNHYTRELLPPTEYQFSIETKQVINGVSYCSNSYFEFFPGTVMFSGGQDRDAWANSESVKLFYIKEILGLVDGSDHTEFVELNGVNLIESSIVDSLDDKPVILDPCD